MNQNIAAFFAEAEQDAVLQRKITGLQDEPDPKVFVEKMVAIAQDSGHAFTVEEFIEASREVTDDQLADVSGGTSSSGPTDIADNEPSFGSRLKRTVALFGGGIVQGGLHRDKFNH